MDIKVGNKYVRSNNTFKDVYTMEYVGKSYVILLTDSSGLEVCHVMNGFKNNYIPHQPNPVKGEMYTFQSDSGVNFLNCTIRSVADGFVVYEREGDRDGGLQVKTKEDFLKRWAYKSTNKED